MDPRGLAAIVITENGDELAVGPREVLFATKPPEGAFDGFRTKPAQESSDATEAPSERPGGPKP